MVEKEFSLGGISQIFFTASTVLFLLHWKPGIPEYWFDTKIVPYVLFFIFCILYMISTAKVVSRFSGSKVGVIGALYGLITGMIALLAFTVYRLLSPIPLEFRGTVLYSILVAEIACFGGTAFLTGLFFVVYRKYVLRGEFWIVSGVVFMLAGILYSIFYFNFYSFIVYVYLTMPTIGSMLFEVSLPVSYGSLLFASVLGAVAFLVGKPVGKPVEDTEN